LDLCIINRDYVIISRNLLGEAILLFAKVMSGRTVISGQTFRDVDTAMKNISDFSQPTVPVIGLQTTAAAVITFSPFVAIAILYIIYQRLYALTKFGYRSDVPWLFTDVFRKVDLGIAYAVAVVPLLSILTINFLFADVNAINVSIPYGTTWDIRSFLGLERWVVRDYGIYTTGVNTLASIVLGLFWVSLYLSVMVMLYFFKITSRHRALFKGE
jgi:hypothetical protein